MRLALLLAVMQNVSVGVGGSAPGDTILPGPDSAAMATAYEDEHARELVRLARNQRGALDASVFHYSATARQRISVGIQAMRRDRLLFRRESATFVEWWRDRPSTVTVLGAREVVPVAMGGVRVPDDVADWAESFMPSPGDDRLWISPIGDDFAWHPLVEGGEALYRYATGDTTVIRLPDGREYRLVELRVTPRERDIRRIAGSFWIELDDYAIVQAVFRPAREFDLERDLPTLGDDDDDLDDVPALLKPIRFDIRYITIEYGLWEMRWWMPRLMAFEGHVQVGVARMPINMELAYSEYDVQADRYGLPELPPVTRQLAGHPRSRPRPFSHGVTVVVPDDTASLLDSPHLPASIFSEREVLLTEGEIRQLADRLDALPPTPWAVGRPVVTPPWRLGSGLTRYNRVEGLSAGARLDWDFIRARTDLTARLGSADMEPRVELGVEIPTRRRVWRGAGYHRLAPVDPRLRPFGLANSMTALLSGRDDGMYFEASGAELQASPVVGGGHYRVRLYGERQAPAMTRTDFSLAHVLTGDTSRHNIAARQVDQLGAAFRVSLMRGLDPTGFRWGVSLDVTGETGDASFVRPGVGLLASAPILPGWLGALEVEAGTTLADGPSGVPPQSLWFLGGPATLRGFAGGEIRGRDQFRARAEVATDFPGARLTAFSDAGWAGRFDGYHSSQLALSVGLGGSVLDGLVRLDLARTLQPVERWRLDLYMDALF